MLGSAWIKTRTRVRQLATHGKGITMKSAAGYFDERRRRNGGLNMQQINAEKQDFTAVVRTRSAGSRRVKRSFKPITSCDGADDSAALYPTYKS